MFEFLKDLFGKKNYVRLPLPREYYTSGVIPYVGHLKYYKVIGSKTDGLSETEPSLIKDAELLGSLTSMGYHYPNIDFDFPCVLTKSTTPGHYHFNIQVPMTWKNYYRLLKAMEKAGLVQKRWLDAAKKNKQTMVFLPNKKKKLLNEGKIKQGSDLLGKSDLIKLLRSTPVVSEPANAY